MKPSVSFTDKIQITTFAQAGNCNKFNSTMNKTDLLGEVLSEEMVSELLKDHTSNKNII